MLSERDKKFIKDNKILLEENRFQEFFDKLSDLDRCVFAEFFLLDCGINFLEYMNYIPDQLFYKSSRLKTIAIPNSVTMIGFCAFDSCGSLQSINIPNSVTKIDEHAFYWCKSLQSITIPDSVTEIGYYAFWGCKSLQSIDIPESVTEIGRNAFLGCKSLQSITIPSSVTEIGDNAFNECVSLKEIKLPMKFKDDLRRLRIDENQTKVIWY